MLSYCNTPQCKICRLQVLDTDTEFHSNLAVKQYNLVGDGSCKSKNCIYLITCKHIECHMKYVGFTTTPLNKRLAGHRANIVNGTEGCLMFKHFTKIHNITDMVIKPIEFNDVEFLRSKEKFWMQEINSIFPYGLNDRIEINGIMDAYDYVTRSSYDAPIYTLFNFVKNNRTKKGSGGHNGRDTFQATNFVDNIINNTGVSIAKECRRQIMLLKNHDIYELITTIVKLRLSHNGTFKYNENLLFLIEDLCFYKLHKGTHNVNKYKTFLTIFYSNKLIDYINVGKLFRSSESFNSFPASSDLLKNTGISYKYSPTIRNTFTNYKETVNSVNKNSICVCHLYPQFIDAYHGHVITGDINIIGNPNLIYILGKGLNFREIPGCNIIKAYSSVHSALDVFINSICESTKLLRTNFSAWKRILLNNVDRILRGAPKMHANPVLNDPLNIRDLKDIQDNFVVVPIDKASNNVSFICKKYYKQVLNEEILNSGNFIPSNNTENNIISDYSGLLALYNVKETFSNALPFLYWIPKFHKQPIAARFITSGRFTTPNTLSKVIGVGLNNLLKLQSTISRHHFKYNNINDFYIIEDKKKVVQFINKSNNLTKDNLNIKTFDFKTLYTNIPQSKLKLNISKFVVNVFQTKKKKYISISKYRATLTERKNKSGINFSRQEFIKCINYLIDNCFIKYGNQIFQQIIGIPMGSNCASHLANIFLFIYESSFVKKLVEENHIDDIHKLGTAFRYQDDLILFEEDPNSVYSIVNNYPREMVIKNTNVENNVVNYLDLTISIIDNRYHYKSYDKRKDFNFPIIRYPNLSGNVPLNPSIGVFTSQLYRFCSINLTVENFKKDLIQLINTLCSQGYNINTLKMKFIQFGKNKVMHWAHLGTNITSLNFINSIFNNL